MSKFHGNHIGGYAGASENEGSLYGVPTVWIVVNWVSRHYIALFWRNPHVGMGLWKKGMPFWERIAWGVRGVLKDVFSADDGVLGFGPSP